MGSYAGDISAREAWDILSDDKDAVLIDVRSAPEWQFAGAPDLSSLDKELVKLTWRNYPAFELNDGFADGFKNLSLSPQQKIIFMCKLGGRSADAATLATSMGYSNCYNLANGMEGPDNGRGQRGKVDGWKAHDLPWSQA